MTRPCCVAVPGGDVGHAPDHAGVALLHLVGVGLVDRAAARHRALPLAQQAAQALDDVAHLALDHHQDAAVDDEVGVGSVEHEEVGEVGHSDAEVGPGVAAPLLVELDAAAAEDAHRGDEVRGGEARAVDEDVGRVLDAVGRAHARRGDGGERRRDELDVVAGERGGPAPVVA